MSDTDKAVLILVGGIGVTLFGITAFFASFGGAFVLIYHPGDVTRWASLYAVCIASLVLMFVCWRAIR